MTLQEFVAFASLAVAVAELSAIVVKGRWWMLFTGASVLAVLSLLAAYSVATTRHRSNESAESIRVRLGEDQRTYDELRLELRDIDGPTFDAGLERAIQAGVVGFDLVPARLPNGGVHWIRVYFTNRADTGD